MRAALHIPRRDCPQIVRPRQTLTHNIEVDRSALRLIMRQKAGKKEVKQDIRGSWSEST